jgi:hypothetical protein
MICHACHKGLPHISTDYPESLYPYKLFSYKELQAFLILLMVSPIVGMAQECCQKVLPWGAYMPQTFAVKTAPLFSPVWMRNTAVSCSLRQVFLTIPANLSGKAQNRALKVDTSPPRDSG